MTQKPSTETALFDSQFLRQLERLSILSRQIVAGQMQGERRSPKRGQSVEFTDFRPYSLGDDFRRIDWNAYARLERFFIKLFVEEEDITVQLLLDTSKSMGWGSPDKWDYSVRAAAALGYISLVGLDRTTATALGQTEPTLKHFSPHRGKTHTHKFFSYLQSIHPTSSFSLKTELLEYRATSKKPGPLILFTDLFDENWKDALAILAGNTYEITLMHILSPEEVDPSFNGDLKLIDSETNQEIEITADFDLLQRYKTNFDAWRQEIELFCSKRGIHYIPLVTSLPLHELLFSLMRRQSVLK